MTLRTDASLSIGTGHVMRCITLAGALRKRGAAVSFVCREHRGHLCSLIEERGFTAHRLPAGGPETGREPASGAAARAGAAWQEDAEQTRVAISTSGAVPDWLVVDHYALDRRWESAMRASARHIMVVDDLADREHDCDLLLDQNLVENMHARYAGRVPAACGLLLGPEYALLQPAYAELHGCLPPREGPIRRILVFFGGADVEELAQRCLSAFLSLNRTDIEVDVVVNAESPRLGPLHQQAAAHANIHLHDQLPTLAPLMARADLAIGAAGATSWERLCLGLPTLVVTVADNQVPLAEALSRRGLIRWLGHRDDVSEAGIARALRELIERGSDTDWSRRCFAAVDGRGTDRVCEALAAGSTVPLRVRFADEGDEGLLLEWANDPTTRRNAFSPDAISAEEHRSWFRDRLRDGDGCRLYVVESSEGVPLGQVRFERSGQAWEVHYALAPEFRGRGLARPFLDAALLKLRAEDADGGTRIFGRVKADNRLSCRVFESLGFERAADPASEIAVYQRSL